MQDLIGGQVHKICDYFKRDYVGLCSKRHTRKQMCALCQCKQEEDDMEKKRNNYYFQTFKKDKTKNLDACKNN